MAVIAEVGRVEEDALGGRVAGLVQEALSRKSGRFSCERMMPDVVPAEGASCMYDLPLRNTPEAADKGGSQFAVELVFKDVDFIVERFVQAHTQVFGVDVIFDPIGAPIE